MRDTASATEGVQRNCARSRTAVKREIRVAPETGPRRAHRAPAHQQHHASPIPPPSQPPGPRPPSPPHARLAPPASVRLVGSRHPSASRVLHSSFARFRDTVPQGPFTRSAVEPAPSKRPPANPVPAKIQRCRRAQKPRSPQSDQLVSPEEVLCWEGSFHQVAAACSSRPAWGLA